MNNILVVEDEKSLELLYKLELTQEGYNVISTSTGEDALLILDKEPIDLVILDLKLPRMSGLELLEQMLVKQRNMKVVINTAYSNYKNDFTCWLADDYIVKSSDLSELKSTVRKYIH